MSTTLEPSTDREEWLKARKLALGSSDVPAILGLSPWGSEWEVWADKTNRLEDWKGNKSTRAGVEFESAVLDTAEKDVGALERNVRIVHSALPVSATLDGRVIADGSPVEAKTTGLVGPVYGEWGEALTDQVPDYYLVQVHTQLLVTGAELAYLFALIGGRGVVKYQIERSQKVCDQIGELCDRWWQDHIVNDTAPELQKPPSLEVVRRFRRQAKKRIVFDLGQSALVQQRAALKAEAKLIEGKLEICEAQILIELGDAEAATLSDGSELTYFETKNKGCTIAPYTYRSMKVKARK